jgi:hypothetical protein
LMETPMETPANDTTGSTGSAASESAGMRLLSK